MDTSTRRPLARPSRPVAQSAPHQILVDKARTHHGLTCEPGFALPNEQRAALVAIVACEGVIP